MQDSKVGVDARTAWGRRLLIAGWAVVACGIACLIVVGLSVMMGLVYPSGTLSIVGLVLTAVGAAEVVVATVLARSDDREPQPLSRSRQNRAALVVAVAAFAGVALGMGTIYATNAAVAPASAAIPGTRMTVDQAAQAYLDAAKQHDCWYTATHTDSHTKSWCSNPDLIDFSDVTLPDVGGRQEPDGSQSCAYFDMKTNGDDMSLPAGTQPWGFCFVRQNGVWMLWDQGLG